MQSLDLNPGEVGFRAYNPSPPPKIILPAGKHIMPYALKAVSSQRPGLESSEMSITLPGVTLYSPWGLSEDEEMDAPAATEP